MQLMRIYFLKNIGVMYLFILSILARNKCFGLAGLLQGWRKTRNWEGNTTAKKSLVHNYKSEENIAELGRAK